MGVDFVNKHDTRIGKRRSAFITLNSQGIKCGVHLSNDVYDQSCHCPISITHLAQRKFIAVPAHPKPLRIDFRDFVSAREHAITYNGKGCIERFLCPGPAF